MANYLEGYVGARETPTEIERGRQAIGPATDRPDARALERWLGGFTAMVRKTVSRRPSTAMRSRPSSS